MRKKQLSLIREMSELLKKAHESIRKVIVEKEISEDNLNAVYNLLSQCQSAAINMGTRIEESEGEGFITVKYLEDYCELVYSINEELQSNGGTDNPDKVYKKLTKMLQKIDNSIAHDIPLRREAVFLPYKASMWDSLESVWEAADADPDCDAYVIPIPYFDKNPDGSVREEHYEGDLFPENVPITHYSEYDFGKHHPDMIFIHNPYDYGNLVTTIHPFFYAENMKKVTDCLVYIPYFATSGAMGAEKAWCPVYEYADYIVIQSESYRQYYSKDIPDEKFLAFGSPKFDKVIRKCQNPPIPSKEWNDRAKGKKVLFYNTSLSCMLQSTPRYLKKMKYVFDTFRNHKEYCLLWRPHPLFESTLKAMRPECLEVYRALRAEFMKEDGWILDETPCVEDTIAFCDGYVGDISSSIVALFGVSGKPIFLLADDIVSNDNKKVGSALKRGNNHLDKYSTNKYIITDDNLLYWSPNENYMYERFVDFSNSAAGESYMEVYDYDNTLILAPKLAQNVCFIDKNSRKVEYIQLQENKFGWQFQSSYILEDKLILIPHDYFSIVLIKLDTREVSYINGVSDFIKYNDNGVVKYGTSWAVNDSIFVMSPDANQYIRINVNSLEYTIININLGIEVGDICSFKENNSIWILHKKGPYVTWLNIESNEHKTYDLSIDGLIAKDWNNGQQIEGDYFENCYLDSGYLIVAPFRANKIIKLDLSNGEVEEYYLGVEKTSDYVGRIGYFIGLTNVFYSYINQECYIVSSDEAKECNLTFNKEDILEDALNFKKYFSMSKYANIESYNNKLDDYLRNFDKYKFDIKEQLAAYREVNASMEGNCGIQVYNKLVNE
ncbi:MAG: hypothetical protein IJS76_08050 [Pseudobutyrivibrio sp.]|nr:hypothetical protein [Pseudobutyrivibrio sp.]